MGSTFTGSVVSPVTKAEMDLERPYPVPIEDDEWIDEIAEVERAVEALLALKRTVLREDPQRETTLWYRHIDVLRTIKRKMDALCI